MRILIVEDEYKLAEVVADKLRKAHYEVDIACDGEAGLDNAESGIYDLIILDVMLPKRSGFEILQILRRQNMPVKIIMLTAKSALEDKLTGLTGGADDYITKPFHMDELIARVNLQLRRSEGMPAQNTLAFEDLVLYLSASKIVCQLTGEEIAVVNKEFQLLEYFMCNPYQILSKDMIYDKVWGYDTEIESNNLEAYLSFIRKKLKAIGSCVKIKAVRGMGYRMETGQE